MVTGLCHAYEASGEEKYKTMALATAEFIITQLMAGDHLKRTFKDGQATINAFLDDYTFLISAFIRLYAVTFDKAWLTRADQLLAVVLAEFKPSKADFFNFKSSQDQPLFVTKQVLEDNVIPAGNSELAKNLFLLGTLLEKDTYTELSEKLVRQLESRIKDHAAFYYNWFDLYSLRTARFLEIAVVGPDWPTQRQQVAELFTPYAILLGGTSEDLGLLQGKLQEGNSLIYICLDKTCQAPAKEVDNEMLRKHYLIG